MTTMPLVKECAVNNCSYNHNGCSAFAMNMSTDGCTTFISLGSRGGLDKVTAQVGACQRADCVHNHDLECVATAVRIGASDGECLTYQKA